MDSISLKEVIDFIDTGETFSIGFRTCNVQLGTGGEWLYLPQAKKYKYMTKAEEYAAARKGLPKPELLKNPRHFENSTRNIVAMGSGRLVKIHLRLIRLFNNKMVL